MQWLAVALGGSVGAICRYAIAIALPVVPGKLPAATLLVNVLGSFLIGVFFVVIVEKAWLPIVWRQVLMVGFLGALTTFSTFSMELVQLVYAGHWQVGVLYLLLSVLASVAAASAGYMLFNWLL